MGKSLKVPCTCIVLQMNSFMDTIKFALVISLPNEETFGYLIIVSFASVVFGAASYCSHAIKSLKRQDSETQL